MLVHRKNIDLWPWTGTSFLGQISAASWARKSYLVYRFIPVGTSWFCDFELDNPGQIQATPWRPRGPSEFIFHFHWYQKVNLPRQQSPGGEQLLPSVTTICLLRQAEKQASGQTSPFSFQLLVINLSHVYLNRLGYISQPLISQMVTQYRRHCDSN